MKEIKKKSLPHAELKLKVSVKVLEKSIAVQTANVMHQRLNCSLMTYTDSLSNISQQRSKRSSAFSPPVQLSSNEANEISNPAWNQTHSHVRCSSFTLWRKTVDQQINTAFNTHPFWSILIPIMFRRHLQGVITAGTLLRQGSVM